MYSVFIEKLYKIFIFVKIKMMKNKKMIYFIQTYYPVILAFICLLYSVFLGLLGYNEEAQYSAHWPGTILLFAIAIRQRRDKIKNK